MNLYFVNVKPSERSMASFDDFIVLAEDARKAEQVAERKTGRPVNPNKTKRVPQGHYIVGQTYLFDDFS